MDLLNTLFSSSGFMPHGFCYTWDPYVIWLNAVCDALIACAYYAIPIGLVYFVRRRKDLAFDWMFVCFAVFIVACGTTHVMEVVSIWRPLYWLVGVIKAVTAAASVLTALALIPLIPRALALPSPQALREANRALQEAQGALRKTNEELERRIAERTASLQALNAALRAEVAERNRTEEHLRESEQRFRTMANSIPQLAWMADADGGIFWYNERWYAYTGTTPEQMKGWGWQTLHDPSVLPAVLERWRNSIANGQPFDMAFPLRGADGAFRPFLTRVMPLKNAQGQVIQWFGTNTDITQQQEAEAAIRQANEQLREQAAVLELAPVLVRDLDSRIVLWTEGARRLYGFSKDEALGRVSHELFQTQFPESREQVDEALRHTGRWEGELAHRTRSGERRVVASQQIVYRDASGRPLRTLEVNADITERKEAERQKNEFLALLGHELRNPLAPIRSALHVMGKPVADPILAAQMRQMAERQVGHMARLLDDLLDVARISQGRFELRKELVELGSALERAAESVRPFCEERRHELQVIRPKRSLWVEADRTRLEQVLTNLLNNAAKYTDPGGRIRLSAEAGGGQQAVIRVQDTGIGIAPAMLPRIFELFVQAERRLNRSAGGVGIGLSLVKKLVELHGGRVEAFSPGPGQGSEFVVRLPAMGDAEPVRVAGQASPAAAEPQGAAGPAGLRVLVVDDNVDAADGLAVALKLDGHDVRAAYDGPSALAIAEAFRPQAVLLDLGLPGMDGYEVARRLREKPGLEGTWLAAVTGWGQPEDRQRSKGRGFDRHLVKPVDPALLAQLLAEVEASASR